VIANGQLSQFDYDQLATHHFSFRCPGSLPLAGRTAFGMAIKPTPRPNPLPLENGKTTSHFYSFLFVITG
jgi:hypothetical protein